MGRSRFFTGDARRGSRGGAAFETTASGATTPTIMTTHTVSSAESYPAGIRIPCTVVVTIAAGGVLTAEAY